MTRDDIIRMAGHRDVPAWVMKLVMDCIEAEREACAALCDGIAERNEADHDGEWACGNWECAAAIRARTNQGE